jgi:hypothetical protein
MFSSIPPPPTRFATFTTPTLSVFFRDKGNRYYVYDMCEGVKHMNTVIQP